MTRFVIHNHLPKQTKDGGREVPREQEEENRDRMYKDTGITRVGDSISVKSGRLDSDGIADVEIIDSTKGVVGTGFWDTHASAYWITPKGGSEKVFHDKAQIIKAFGG